MSEFDPMSELDVYRLLFRYFLENGIQKRVSNCSSSHAIVLISELIRAAQSTVDVFCRCLSDAVWGQDEVLSEILKAGQERHVRFRVITQEKIGMNKARKTFSLVDSELRCLDDKSIAANFMIVDGKSFRFEQDCSNREGFAYARNDELAKDLNNAFQVLFNKATIVRELGREAAILHGQENSVAHKESVS